MNTSELEEVIRRAIFYLSDPYTQLPNNPAIVFDIDGTLIDHNGQLILPVVALYKFSKSFGITPFIITARVAYNDSYKNYTLNQLFYNGITEYKMLFMAPNEFIDPVVYKLNSRKYIYDEGYNVIMSIGDNKCDIGEYGGIGILLA